MGPSEGRSPRSDQTDQSQIEAKAAAVDVAAAEAEAKAIVKAAKEKAKAIAKPKAKTAAEASNPTTRGDVHTYRDNSSNQTHHNNTINGGSFLGSGNTITYSSK